MNKTEFTPEDCGKAGKPRRRTFEEWLFHVLSTQWCGNDMVPLDHDTLRFTTEMHCEQIVSFGNDSFELYFGSPERWDTFIRREDFHKIMRWYLWRWGWGEWFGLRRWLWYKLLFRRVAQYKSVGKVG